MVKDKDVDYIIEDKFSPTGGINRNQDRKSYPERLNGKYHILYNIIWTRNNTRIGTTCYAMFEILHIDFQEGCD